MNEFCFEVSGPVSRMWLPYFEFDWGLLYWTWGALGDCFWSIEEALNPKI